MRKFITVSLAAFAAILMSGTLAAQQADSLVSQPFGEDRAVDKLSERNGFSSKAMDLEIVLADEKTNYGGLQFTIKYDPSIGAVDVGSCLAGVPESHLGAFTACTVLEDRNEIRVAITDIGKNRLIPAGLLGVIGISASKPVSASSFRITTFEALDTEGSTVRSIGGSEVIELGRLQ